VITYSKECNSGELLGEGTELEEVADSRKVVVDPIQYFGIGAEVADQLDVHGPPKPSHHGANPSQPGISGAVVRGAEEDDPVRAV